MQHDKCKATERSDDERLHCNLGIKNKRQRNESQQIKQHEPGHHEIVSLLLAVPAYDMVLQAHYGFKCVTI